jgi:predicted PurR-regulated permease PerM
MLEIIPIIGPWSAAGIAVSVALFQSEVPFGMSNLGLGAVVALTYLILRMIEENILLPQVMGPLVTLHPAVVIFALLSGGALLGPFGLFISIPVAAVIRIVLAFLYQKITDLAEPPHSPATDPLEPEPAPQGAASKRRRASH